MSRFFDDTIQGLVEAVIIEKGNIPLTKKEGMPAPTYIVEEKEQNLIDEMIRIRKNLNMSQSELAELTGNRQQALSRIEKKENSPSLKTFMNIIYALGYELKIVKI